MSAVAEFFATLVAKYRPDQPRAPKGDPDGGRFVAEGSGIAIASTDAREVKLWEMPGMVDVSRSGGYGSRVGIMPDAAIAGPRELLYTRVPRYGTAADDMDYPELAAVGEDALRGLPAEHRAMLAAIKTRVFLAEEDHPAEQPSLFGTGITFGVTMPNMMAAGMPTEMAINLHNIEPYSAREGLSAEEMTQAVVLHETGHAIDHALYTVGVKETHPGMRSLDRRITLFGRALSADIQSAPGTERMGDGLKMSEETFEFAQFYNPSANAVETAIPEAWADSYAYLMGASVIRRRPAVDFARRFPRTISIVQRTLHRAGLPTVRKAYRLNNGRRELILDGSMTASGQPEVLVKEPRKRKMKKADTPTTGSGERKRHPKGGKWAETGPAPGRFADKDGIANDSPEGKAANAERRKEQAQKQRGTGGGFDLAVWTDKPVPDRVKAFAALDEAERDRLANASTTIKRAVQSVSAVAGEWDGTADFSRALKVRATELAREGYFAKDSLDTLVVASQDFHDTLLEARAPVAAARRLAETFFDHLAAQEAESISRSLGDHGVRHLLQDFEQAMDILKVVPGSEEYSAENKAILMMAGAFHDAGYLTPPSRVFLDKEHPRWSGQHFNANLRGAVREALGDGAAREVQHIIMTHYESNVDWENDKLGSAFRLADNIALFQREKLPGVLRYVPNNRQVLTDLYNKKISLEQARERMVRNVSEKQGLHPAVKQRLLRAALEVSPIMPKLTLGMYGGRVDSFEWDKLEMGVKVNIRIPPKHAPIIESIGSLGTRTFVKLGEAYGYDEPKLAAAMQTGKIEFRNKKGRRVIYFDAGRALDKALRWLRGVA